jgi:hypothetical protein
MADHSIYCPCGKWVGNYHPATRHSPEAADGPGEDFSDDDGNWHCSEECLEGSLAASAQTNKTRR